MTDSPPCPDLEVYLDGDLPDADARAVETHVSSCASCADELAVARRIAAEFAALRDETCPPDLVASAIAAAQRRAPNRAPDRAASPAARRAVRVNRWALACALLAVGAIGLSRLVADRPPPAEPAPDTLAEVRPARPSAPPAAPDATAPDATTPDAAASRPEADAPRPARATPTVRRAPRASAPADPTPAVAADPDALAPLAADAEATAPDAADVERAQADLLLALALVADAQTHARANVSHQLERAADALHDTPVF